MSPFCGSTANVRAVCSSWNSRQGKVTGSVNKKLVAPTDIEKHHAASSPQQP